MAQYIKYQMPFADIENKQYRVNIYGETDEVTPPETILLQAGDNPLTIEEDKSDDFFTPVRTQTGNLGVCTKLPSGGMLNLDDLLPSTNLSTPVRVEEYVNGAWQIAWLGFLKCEMYNQSYTELPDNISLPIISILEAWKSVYINENKIERIVDLIVEIYNKQTGNQPIGLYVPEDYAIVEKLINTSIFVSVKEYNNEENTLYELQGSSAYDIISSICTFMGWTAREDKGVLYLEVMQGYGLMSGTETRNMSSLVWRGTNHQRSIRQGKRIGIINAKLAEFDIKTGLAGIPFGSFNYEKYQQIGTGGWWAYFLPSSNVVAYNNMTLRFSAGSIKMGIQYDPAYQYAFNYLSDSVDVDEMIQSTIAYLGGYPAMSTPTLFSTIYAGACFARMQFDEYNEPDNQHQNTSDGLFVSLFPGAYDTTTPPTQHIFEMRAVQNFASIYDGYINLSTAFKLFAARPWVGVQQADDKLCIDIQVGDKIWNGNDWVPASINQGKFLADIDIDGEKIEGNWNDQMDIDQVDGYLIPTWYMDGSTKKHVMGPLTLRIYPETYIQNIDSYNRGSFVCNIFFEELSLNYIPKRSIKMSNRSENNYRTTINSEFAEDIEISTKIASWLNNNPSPSLIYEQNGEPLKTLPYLKPDGVTTVNQRPEINLLNRVKAFYNKPRTILELVVKHIDDKPLPLLRLNGIDDGKLYVPVAESRDFFNNVSKITCIETPTE